MAAGGSVIWQTLARHGVQNFASISRVHVRSKEVEGALAELCGAIAKAAVRRGNPGIERARSLRAKSIDGGKSLYECLNQLIHYWYCCAAAKDLLRRGFIDVRSRPTAEESTSKENDAFDLVARHPDGLRVVGEVFCVSSSLWPLKIRKTAKKLVNAPSSALRLIYYNRDAKPTYAPNRFASLVYLGVDSPSGNVDVIWPPTEATSALRLPQYRIGNKKKP